MPHTHPHYTFSLIYAPPPPSFPPSFNEGFSFVGIEAYGFHYQQTQVMTFNKKQILDVDISNHDF
jgi:hypothetical protein